MLAGDASTGGFVWDLQAGWTPIAGPGHRRPLYLSGDGNVVLGGTDSQISLGETYLWDRTTGTIDTIVAPAGTTYPFPQAINEDGTVIVGFVNANLEIRAAVWDETGTPTLIDPVAGGLMSQAFGVSPNGEWVVGTRSGGQRAFCWSQATGVQALPTIGAPTAMVYHSGKFASDDGNIVVGYRGDTRPFSMESTSIIAIQGAATVRFRDFLLARGGPDLGPSIVVRGMSRDGMQFVAEANGTTYWIDVDPVVSVAYCSPAVPNSTGAPGQVAALGSAEVAEAFLALRATSLPPGAVVLPIMSMTQGHVPMAGGSAGTLCLGGSIGRITVGAASASGDYELGIDLSAIPAGSGATSVSAGETWTFQVWHRDVAGSNFTDAAEVTFR